MLGNIVNFLTILIGSLLGFFFKGGIPEKYNATIIKAMGLSVVVIGISNALKFQDLLLVIISMAIGSIIGEFFCIEDKLDKLGKWIEGKMSKGKESNIAKGFVTASLLFCVGSMAIVGALESGLNNNHQTLLAKSVIDGITSIVLASSLGIGVMFSAVSVFLYQGTITLTATFMKQFLVESVITDMSAVGGLLIIGIGLNMLEMNKIKVGNMLPAIFIPLVYFIIRTLIGF